MCPDWESSKRPFGSQAGAQSTDPHQPGQSLVFLDAQTEKLSHRHKMRTLGTGFYKVRMTGLLIVLSPTPCAYGEPSGRSSVCFVGTSQPLLCAVGEPGDEVAQFPPGSCVLQVMASSGP